MISESVLIRIGATEDTIQTFRITNAVEKNIIERSAYGLELCAKVDAIDRRRLECEKAARKLMKAENKLAAVLVKICDGNVRKGTAESLAGYNLRYINEAIEKGLAERKRSCHYGKSGK